MRKKFAWGRKVSCALFSALKFREWLKPSRVFACILIAVAIPALVFIGNKNNEAKAATSYTIHFILDSSLPESDPGREYIISANDPLLEAPRVVNEGDYLEDVLPPAGGGARISFRGWSVYDPNEYTQDGFYTREKFWAFNQTVNPYEVDPASDDGLLDGQTLDYFINNNELNLYAVFSDAVLVNFKDPITGKIEETYEVKLTLENGNVVGDSYPAPSRETVALVTSSANSITPGQRVAFWYEEDTPAVSSNAIVFGSTTTEKDVTLVPFFSDSYVVMFDTAGGSYVPSRIVLYAGNVAKPSDPEREGYEFKYWSTNENADPNSTVDEFDFDTQAITSDTTLFAIWEPNDVSYKVIYWLEKTGVSGTPSVPGDYEFYKTFEVPSSLLQPAGSVVSYSDAELTTLRGTLGGDRDFPGYYSGTGNNRLYYTKLGAGEVYSISEPLKGDGTGVVNVYFDRKEYTICFDMGAANLIKVNGTLLNDRYYYVTAKVGTEIWDLFPTITNPKAEIQDRTSGARYFNYFSVSGLINSEAWYSIRPMLVSELLPTNGSNNYTVTAAWTSVATITRFNYMIEALDQEEAALEYYTQSNPGVDDFNGIRYYNGLYYRIDNNISEDKFWYNNGIYTSQYCKPIDGLIVANLAPGKGGNGLTDGYNKGGTKTNPHMLYLYYKRTRYTVFFDVQCNDSYVSPDSNPNVMYGRSLASLSLPLNPVRDEYNFLGWYKNAECTDDQVVFRVNSSGDLEVVGDPTMPNGDLTLFAKWEPAEVSVEFYDSTAANAQLLGTKYTSAGGTITELTPLDPGAEPIYTTKYEVGESYLGKGKFQGWVWLVEGEDDIYPQAFKFGDNGTTIVESGASPDMKVYATWETLGLTVTYNPVMKLANGDTMGAWIDDDDPVIDENTYALNQWSRVKDGSAKVIEPVYNGDTYVFYGWTSEGQSEGILSYAFNEHKMTADTKLVAYYGKISESIKIVYHAVRSSSELIDATNIVQYGPVSYLDDIKKVNLAGSDAYRAKANTYYQLVGWYLAQPGESVTDSINKASAPDAVEKVREAVITSDGRTDNHYYPVGFTGFTTPFTTFGSSDDSGDIEEDDGTVNLYAVWRVSEWDIIFEVENNGIGGKLKANSDAATESTRYTVYDVPHSTLYSAAMSRTGVELEKNSDGFYAPIPVPNPGYHFKEWSPALPADDLEITVGLKFTAKFELDEYTIEYKTGVAGASVFDEAAYSYPKSGNTNVINYGDSLSAEAPAPDDSLLIAAGYTFAGWSDDGTNNPKYLTTQELYDEADGITGNAVYTAVWIADTETKYKVEYYYQKADGTWPLEADAHVWRIGTTGEPVSVTDADKTVTHTDAVYVFDSAYSGNVLSDEDLNGDGSTILKVYFLREYTIIFAPGSKGLWTDTSETYQDNEYGDATPAFGSKSGATLTDCEDGWIFSGWSPKLSPYVTDTIRYVAQWIEAPPPPPEDPEEPEQPDPESPALYYVYYLYQKENGTYPSLDEAKAAGYYTIRNDAKDGDTVEVTLDDKESASPMHILNENANEEWEGKAPCDLAVYFKLQLSVTYAPGVHGQWDELNEKYNSKNYGDPTPVFGSNSGVDPDVQKDAGYHLAGWMDLVTGIVYESTAKLPAKVTKNVTYIALWEADPDTPYKVEFYYMDENGDYPVAPEKIENRTGPTDSLARLIDPDDYTPMQASGFEYMIDHTPNGDPSAPRYLGNIEADGSLVLKIYFKRTYTVIYDPGTQGSWSVHSETYDALDYGVDTPYFGKHSDPSATSWDVNDSKWANIGYAFDGWDIEIAGKVTKSVTYTAKWRALPSKYRVEYFLIEDGVVTLAREDNFEALTGTDVKAALLKFTGFSFNESDIRNITEGVVNGEGTLILQLYYVKSTDSTPPADDNNDSDDSDDVIDREVVVDDNDDKKEDTKKSENTVVKDVPDTGDESSLPTWIFVFVVTALCLAQLAIKYYRKKREENRIAISDEIS
jgi:uncharacterized repeat protein (TIGR02543 family)